MNPSETIQRATRAALLEIAKTRLDDVGPSVDAFAAQCGIHAAMRSLLTELQSEVWDEDNAIGRLLALLEDQPDGER